MSCADNVVWLSIEIDNGTIAWHDHAVALQKSLAVMAKSAPATSVLRNANVLPFRTSCSGIGAVEQALGALSSLKSFQFVSVCDIKKRCQDLFMCHLRRAIRTGWLAWLEPNIYENP